MESEHLNEASIKTVRSDSIANVLDVMGLGSQINDDKVHVYTLGHP